MPPLGQLADYAADEIIDATDLLVLPGGVDTHVHFNDVFMNTISVHDYYTGTRAAAFGGTTTIIDFSNQAPGASLMSTIANKQEEAFGRALIDYGVHPVITQATQQTLVEIPKVVAAGSPTIKCYMTYRDEGLLMEDDDLRHILVGLRDAGGMLLVHAEDNDLIEESIPQFLENNLTSPIYHAHSKPPTVENKAMERIIQMNKEIGGRLFICAHDHQRGCPNGGDSSRGRHRCDWRNMHALPRVYGRYAAQTRWIKMDLLTTLTQGNGRFQLMARTARRPY